MLQKVKLFFYRIGQQKPWKKLFAKFETKTKVCRICFEPLTALSFHELWHYDLCVCPRCQEKFSTIFAKSKLQDVKVLAIYEYNEFMQTNLYKLKGCADLEMSAAFLSYHQLFLRLKYRNYTLIPAPSFSENDVQRGFNHVEEIFKGVGKETLKAIIKISNRKQSDLSAVERSKVGEVLCWNDDVNITNKKILLVDDVMTTGSTIQACLSLIKKHNPKSIEVVVMSKVKNKGER